MLGTSVTYEGYDEAVGDIVEQTAAVRSLLSPDGIRFMLTSPVANFLGFTGVGVILVAMIGVGLAEESGLIATLVRKLVAIAPERDLHLHDRVRRRDLVHRRRRGLPRACALGRGRLPQPGAASARGACGGLHGVAAVFLVNVFVTPTDALLVEVTNDAIRTVNPAPQISPVGNLFFMIASSIVMAIICTRHHREIRRAAAWPLHRRRAGREERRADRGRAGGPQGRRSRASDRGAGDRGADRAADSRGASCATRRPAGSWRARPS